MFLLGRKTALERIASFLLLIQRRTVSPNIRSVVFGMATSVAADQFPELRFDGTAFVAPIDARAGNWNLRVVAEAADGTIFRQRIIVRVVQ